jgi:hypothetical protein
MFTSARRSRALTLGGASNGGHRLSDHVGFPQAQSGRSGAQAFRAKILDKRNYWLSLSSLVYYHSNDEHATVEQIVGRYRGAEKSG